MNFNLCKHGIANLENLQRNINVIDAEINLNSIFTFTIDQKLV